MRLALFAQPPGPNALRAIDIRSDDERDYAAFDWNDGAPIHDSWYYRAVGRAEPHLLEIEIAGGRLRSVDCLIGRATPGLFDAARSITRVALDAHPLLALEALDTASVARVIPRGVDVRRDVQVWRSPGRLMVGFGFDEARRAFGVGSDVTYFTTEEMHLVGLDLRT
ncbi:hypothetical protein [Tahibacter soli]|uniref:Uncharacterized protein n=1 Tax=Tahibacter soli TaxID=2983605 RepID=A0A9X3YQN8_9GAMM|nr:hypothetical protein [Tahibacter soli]MDC8015745.1 hypothetical protein [Tahibacter soli]